MHHIAARASDSLCLWMSCIQLGAESHSVMSLRLLAMGGAWPMPEGEYSQMLSEKAPAFTEAFVGATLSALSGDFPEKVGRIALAPLTTTTRQNRLRLTQDGLRPGCPSLSVSVEDGICVF